MPHATHRVSNEKCVLPCFSPRRKTEGVDFGNEIVMCSQSQAPSTREHHSSQYERDANKLRIKQPGFDPDRSYRLKRVGDFYMLIATGQWLPF